MGNQQLDLLMIGGGMTSCGIALDAATRRMKVALVEMQDFAAGTSNRSTQLVHGEIRYLKQFEVGMVAERDVLLFSILDMAARFFLRREIIKMLIERRSCETRF
jgi:glycerol-3-phosphate dehydrogenase